MACHCNEFSRAHMLRSAVAEAGRGLPHDRARDAAAGGHRPDRRSFLLRAGLGMLSVYGASKLGLESAAGRDRTRRRASRTRCLSDRVHGRRLGLAVDPRADAGPALRSMRPTLKLAPGAGTDVSGGRVAALAPARRPRWTHCIATGKVTVLPCDRLRRPRPVALHLAPLLGGRRAQPERAHRLDGPADRLIGTDDNPLQGLSLDGWLSPVAGHRARARWRPSTDRATTCGRRVCGETSRT